MKRRTLLKTGLASMVAGLLPAMSFVDAAKPLTTVRFTEAITGTKWLIKYFPKTGYKVFQKKRFLYKEIPSDIEWLTAKINSLDHNNRDDFGDRVSICYKNEPRKKPANQTSSRWGYGVDINCKKLSVEYDPEYLKLNFDEKQEFLAKAV